MLQRYVNYKCDAPCFRVAPFALFRHPSLNYHYFYAAEKRQYHRNTSITSAGCPRQIVRYSAHAYAFQCHLEFTSAAVEGMIANNNAELQRYQHLPYVARTERMRGYDYRAMNALLAHFLDCFLDGA